MGLYDSFIKQKAHIRNRSLKDRRSGEDRRKAYSLDYFLSGGVERRKARELRNTQWWKRRCAKGHCHYCGRPVPPKELTMDHIVPIARGGKSIKNNVVTACKECNNEKKQRLPMEWEQYLKKIQRDKNPSE